MKGILYKVKAQIRKLIETGFFYIVISNTLSKAVAFFGGMILVRVLTKDEYGLYSSVINILGILMILADFGVADATMQLSQENYKNETMRKAYCSLGFKYSFAFSFISVFFIGISYFAYPYTIDGTRGLVLALCLWPVLNNINAYLSLNLRMHLENKKFALLNTLAVIIHYAVILPMSLYWGVNGAVFSNYIISILVLIISIICNKKILYFGKSYIEPITRNAKKVFMKLALITQLNNTVAQFILLMDLFLIGIFYSDTSIIASYKVASSIPSAVLFIPSSINLYLIPYFSRHKDDIEWVEHNYKKALAGCMGICGFISVVGILTSKWIIPLIYGTSYKDSITCYIILLIGFFFTGGIKSVSMNILYTQRKVKVTAMITLFVGILNIILDIVGIGLWGSIGAAIASSSVYFTGAVISTVYMVYHLKKRKINIREE